MRLTRVPALLAALLGCAAAFTGGVEALTPPAGTLIVSRSVANCRNLNGHSVTAVAAALTSVIAAGPRLSVSLTQSPAVLLPGQTFTYTLSLSNTGNAAASGVTASLYLPPEVSTASLSISGGGVLDPASRTVSWPAGALASGGTGSLTVSAQASAALIDGFVFASSAAASAAGGQYSYSVSSATAGSAPLLDISISAPASVIPGGTLTYTLGYSNNGNAAAGSARISAPTPPMTAYAAGSATSGGYRSGANVFWDIGSVAAGSSGTVAYSVSVSTLAPAGSTLLNSASLVSPAGSASSPQVSTLVSDPAAVFTSTAAPAQVVPGGRVTLAFVFTNDPAAPLAGVSVTALLPERTTFVSADNAGTYASGTAVWNLGDLLAGESRTVRMSVDVSASLAPGSLVISTATAAAPGMTMRTAYSTVTVTAASASYLIFTDQSYARAGAYRPGDILYLELNSALAGQNAAAVETATVTVTCAATGDSETVTLTETAPGSGIFRGSLTSSASASAAGSGALTVAADSAVRAARSGGPDGSFYSEALIDPYGVVFNSVTGAPVSGAVVTLLDSASGNPAVLGSGQQNPYTTDAAGRYYFPFVPAGSYRLSVAPGAGYSFPTVLSTSAVAAGFMPGSGSKGEIFTLSSLSAVSLDLPADPGAAAFSAAKTCDRTEANTGDLLFCTVTLTNTGASPAAALRLADLLPHGFAYAGGTTLIDGAKAAEPALSSRGAVWTVPSPAAGASVSVRYAMLLGADAANGDGVNRAYAEGSTLGGAFVSNTAAFKVRVGGGVFTSRGTILGRVFTDDNGDGLYSEGEAGVPGAEVYTEDGVRARTDGLGMYHIDLAQPGARVVRLDLASLPPGLRPEPIHSRFAGDGVSQFADMDRGGLRKANFALRRAPGLYAGSCVAPASAPAAGLSPSPATDYAAALAEGPRDLAILFPADGSAAESRSLSAAVRFPAGSALKLTLNGEAVADRQIGRRSISTANSAELYEFVGLALRAGTNVLLAEVYDPFGNKRAEASASVTAPGDPARVDIRLPAPLPTADGRSVFAAEALLVDANGLRLPYSGTLTVEVGAGALSGNDADTSAPGFQVSLEDGSAFIAVRAPEDPGKTTLKASYNSQAAGAVSLEYKPYLRDMLVTGLADLRLGRASAGGASSPLKKGSFMEKGAYANGRGAFFAKGRLWKELDLTAAYDTAKETGGAQFRQDEAAPDSEARYPLYGDTSELRREPQSSDKLYLKAAVRGTSLLWGDYWTGLQDTRLSQHQRSLTGAKLQGAAGPARLTAFAARTDYTRAVKAQRGKGTAGFYYLDVLPVVPGSERVVIETRDRRYPDRMLSRRQLARNSDYTADYELGAVLFKEPVPSFDQDFNPVYVVVSYESAGGERDNDVYGGRLSGSSGPLDLGVTGAVEENQAGDFRLTGADAALRLPQGTVLRAEAAATRSLFDEGGVFTQRGGSAWTAGVETRPLDLFTLTLFKTRAGRHFNNTSSLESARGSDRFEAGLRAPLGGAWTARGKFAEDRDTLNGGAVRTRSAGLERKGKKYSGSLDLEDEESSKRYIPAGLPGSRTPFDFSEAVPARRTSAQAKARAELGALALTGELRQDVRSGLYTSAQAGADYRYRATRFYLRELYDRSGDRRETRAVAGAESAIAGGLTAAEEYRLRQGASGSALQQSLGLRERHAFNRSLTGLASVEHLRTLSGDRRLADPDAFAVSAGLEYLPHDRLKLNGRAEYRTSEAADSWLGEFNSAFSLGRGWALQNNNRLAYESLSGGGLRRSGRYSLGLSFRPEYTDVFNGLLRTEYRETRGIAAQGGFGAFIFSGEGVWQPSRPLQVTGRYAAKLSRDGGFSAYTDLAAIKVFRDLGRRWDIGGEYRQLISRRGGGAAYGGFAEAGYRLAKDLWLSAGYSFDRFDPDLAGDGYWGKGPYLRLRVKFDDTLFRAKDSDGDGVGDAADKCPGGPGCGPVSSDGCGPATPLPAEEAVPPPPPAAPQDFTDSDYDGIADAADNCPDSAHCAVVDSSGCACPYQEPVLNLNIVFPPGKAEIGDEYQEGIGQAAELLEENPGLSLEIEGHTDNSGRAEDNLRLSRARAENVRDTLIERYGAEADLVTAAGYGDTRPVSANDTPEGKRRNRRVVAVLHKPAPPEAGKCRLQPETEKDERGCPKPLKAAPRTSVRLDILFETGKADILPEYLHEIEELAGLLSSDPEALAEIEGHTDNAGDPELNRALSLRRAKAVADLLVGRYSIAPDRLDAHGYGDSRPISGNDTEAGRRKNRRVIAIITKKKQ